MRKTNRGNQEATDEPGAMKGDDKADEPTGKNNEGKEKGEELNGDTSTTSRIIVIHYMGIYVGTLVIKKYMGGI